MCGLAFSASPRAVMCVLKALYIGRGVPNRYLLPAFFISSRSMVGRILASIGTTGRFFLLRRWLASSSGLVRSMVPRRRSICACVRYSIDARLAAV